MLDADLDENGELLAHTFDLIRHIFTKGNDPIDIHESLRGLFPGCDLGYSSSTRADGQSNRQIRGATR